jgi:hypothetical protein
MSIALRVLAAFAVVSCIVGLVYAFHVWQEVQSSSGFFSLETLAADVAKPLLIAFGTILGIVSSTIFSALNRPKPRSTRAAIAKAFSSRTIVLAAIVAPVVIAGFYSAVEAIEGGILLFVISYQNGFFWENVGALARKPEP